MQSFNAVDNARIALSIFYELDSSFFQKNSPNNAKVCIRMLPNEMSHVGTEQGTPVNSPLCHDFRIYSIEHI